MSKLNKYLRKTVVEKGEYVKDNQGNVSKITQAPTHNDPILLDDGKVKKTTVKVGVGGGLALPAIDAVLSDTHSNRSSKDPMYTHKDEQIKISKKEAKDFAFNFGLKINTKKSMSPAKVLDLTRVAKKKADLKFTKAVYGKDRFAQASKKFNTDYIESLPDEAGLFDEAMNLQESKKKGSSEIGYAQTGEKLPPYLFNHKDKEGKEDGSYGLNSSKLPITDKYEKERDWMKNWVDNRPTQMRKLTDDLYPKKNYNKSLYYDYLASDESKEKALVDFNQSTKQGFLDRIDSVNYKDAKIPGNTYIDRAAGSYSPSRHDIHFPTSMGGKASSSTVAHETAHASGLNNYPLSTSTTIKETLKDDPIYKESTSRYLKSSDEINSRIFGLRRSLNLKPSDIITKGFLLQKLKENRNSVDLQNLPNIMTTDSLIKLMNELVSTDSKKVEQYAQAGLQVRSDSMSHVNRNLQWIDRARNPSKYGNKNLPDPNGSDKTSSHFMTYSDDNKGNYYIYPTMMLDDSGELKDYGTGAEAEARRRGEVIQTRDRKLAQYYTENGLINHKQTGGKWKRK